MTEAPQMLLPFAEREYVDVRRCARILGVTCTTVYRIAEKIDFDGTPLLTVLEYRTGAHKRILYSSIVRFCDKLRARHMIKDRRPPLDNPLLRNKDEDLLPFPLADTICAKEALDALGYANITSLTALIEEGAFEAYKLINGREWRISRSSFSAYLKRVYDRSSGVRPRVPADPSIPPIEREVHA